MSLLMIVMVVPLTLYWVKYTLYWVKEIFEDIFGIKLVKVKRLSTPTLREVASLLAYLWGSFSLSS